MAYKFLLLLFPFLLIKESDSLVKLIEDKAESTLEVYTIETGERKVIYSAKEHFEAPNWSRDGSFFVYNSNGKIYTLPVAGGTPKLLNTGFAQKCNNDHGISPDNTQL